MSSYFNQGSGDPGSGNTSQPSALGPLTAGPGMEHDVRSSHHGEGVTPVSAAGSAGTGVGGAGGPGGPGGMHLPGHGGSHPPGIYQVYGQIVVVCINNID